MKKYFYEFFNEALENNLDLTYLSENVKCEIIKNSENLIKKYYEIFISENNENLENLSEYEKDMLCHTFSEKHNIFNNI